MPVLLIYIIKFSISLAVVFLFYQLVLRRLTFYNWNRIYLLGYSLLSFVVPFIDISSTLQYKSLDESNMINWLPLLQLNQATETKESLFTVWNVLSFLFIIGVVFMSVRLVVQLISYRRMVRKAKLISNNGFNIYQVDEDIIPFSFGNSVFINSRLHSEAELQEIIRHEIVHVKQRHSVDIIFSEILCLVNWFNPFAWLIRKAIRQNLEFIADNKVLDHGMDKKQYQYLLLKVIGNNHFSIAPKFNFSSLKKRIAMMNKLKSAKVNLLRFLFVLPLLAVILVSFRNQLGDSTSEKYLPAPLREFVIADTVPEVTSANMKGYIINIKDKNGECEVIVKDRKGKEVKRVLLTDWNNDSEKYNGLYGQIPPPPPPMPPAPPAPVKLPENVQRISVSNDMATVWLKDGNKESFDLNVASQKDQFEKKYGKLPPPPPPVPPVPPVAPIAPIGMNEGIKKVADRVEITDKEAVLHLKNGAIERYDLKDKESRQKFEDKYGEVIPLPPAPPKPERNVIEVLSNNFEAVDASEWAIKRSPNQNILIRANKKNPLIILDGKAISQEEFAKLDNGKIQSINVLKDKSAVTSYGDKGKNGVLEIRTKDKNENYLIILNGKEITEAEMHELNPNSIESISILKGKNATDIYKEKGKDGVMVITSK